MTYFTGPQLQKNKLQTLFSLPSPRTLLKHKPSLNESILNMIHCKVNNLSEKDKLCVICFDEMAIKADLLYNRNTGKGEKALFYLY